MEIRRSIMSPCNGDDGHLPARKFQAERGTNEPLVSRPTRLKNYIRRMDALNSRLAVPSSEEMPSVRGSIIRHFLFEHRWTSDRRG